MARSTSSSTKTSLARPKYHPTIPKYFCEYLANNDGEKSNVHSLDRIFASFIDSLFSDGGAPLSVTSIILSFHPSLLNV
jgi:hypothetical protein